MAQQIPLGVVFAVRKPEPTAPEKIYADIRFISGTIVVHALALGMSHKYEERLNCLNCLSSELGY